MANIKPAFEVKSLEGQFVERTIYKYDKDAKALGQPPIVPTKVIEPAGYLVFFPNGNSLRVKDEAELKRLGFHRDPYKVDLDTGEMVPEEPMSLERAARNKNKQNTVINFVAAPETENAKER